jgi:hypothetical protein
MNTIFSKLFVVITVTILLVTPCFTQAQEEAKPEEKPKPVRSPYEAGMLIETQTHVVWRPKTVEFVILHRFGALNSYGFDMLGLYAPSNIKMGINYGLFKNAQIGIASTKNGQLQEFNYKYKILTQTRTNSMPIGMAYYGNTTYDSRADNALFGYEYKPSNRMSFFNQLIIARKFSKKITLQVSAMHAHFNQIDTAVTPDLVHSNFGFGVAGRVKFSSQGAVIFEYDMPLTTPKYDDLADGTNPSVKPNISLGLEFATSGHAFHFFVTTYNAINPQKNLMYNVNDFTNQDLFIGFNITRNWNF